MIPFDFLQKLWGSSIEIVLFDSFYVNTNGLTGLISWERSLLDYCTFCEFLCLILSSVEVLDNNRDKNSDYIEHIRRMNGFRWNFAEIYFFMDSSFGVSPVKEIWWVKKTDRLILFKSLILYAEKTKLFKQLSLKRQKCSKWTPIFFIKKQFILLHVCMFVLSKKPTKIIDRAMIHSPWNFDCMSFFF